MSSHPFSSIIVHHRAQILNLLFNLNILHMSNTAPTVVSLGKSNRMAGTSANTSAGAAMQQALLEQNDSTKSIMSRQGLAGGRRRKRQRGGNSVVIVPTTPAGAAGAYGPGSNANATTALHTSLNAKAQSQYDSLAPEPGPDGYEFKSSTNQGGGTRKKRKKRKRGKSRATTKKTRRIYRWIKKLGTCSRKKRGGRSRRRRAGSRRKRGRGRRYSRRRR